MAEPSREVYRQSRFYDIAFSRDVGPEVDFLDAVFRRWAGRRLTTFLDLACGPGYHARELARRGVRASGLDIQLEMVAYAADQARAGAEPAVEWLVGDMRDIEIARPVDLIYCANSGFDYLLTTDDAVRHLRAVARALVPDGLYVFEMSHPSECHPFEYGTWHYHGERDGTVVFIDWGANRPVADPLTQISEVEVVVRAVEDGREHTFRDISRERHIFPPEVEALCALSGAMRVVAWHGAFDADQPLDASPSSNVMLGVLARAAPASPHP